MSDSFGELFAQYQVKMGITKSNDLCAEISKTMETLSIEKQEALLKEFVADDGHTLRKLMVTLARNGLNITNLAKQIEIFNNQSVAVPVSDEPSAKAPAAKPDPLATLPKAAPVAPEEGGQLVPPSTAPKVLIPRPPSGVANRAQPSVADDGNGGDGEGEAGDNQDSAPTPQAPRPPRRPSSENTPEVTQTEEKTSFISRLTSDKKKLGITVGIVLGVIVVLGLFIFFAFSGGSFGSGNSSYDIGDGPIIDPDFSSVGENGDNNPVSDEEFWFGLREVDVPELSPGNMGGQQNAKTVVGIVLLIVVTLFAFFEGRGRKKGQQGSLFFSMAGVLAGWLTMPMLIFMSNTASVGMFWLASMLVMGLWVLAASTIKSQSDLTPFTVALAVFTGSLFYHGKFEIVAKIGSLFNQTWNSWAGVTTVGGAMTLMMTGRAASAILTTLIFILSLVVIYLASREVGKKHGTWAPYVIGISIIALYSLTSWGLNAGVAYLVNTQNLSVIAEVVLRVLAPLVAWLLSLLVSVLIGAGLGDVEVGFSENRQKLGLQKSGTFIENMSDFLILGTIIPLFLGVILQFA